MQSLRFLLDSMWSIFNLPITIDNYTLRIWYFIAFPFIIALFINIIFGKKVDKE
jgi:hypothetical protein